MQTSYIQQPDRVSAFTHSQGTDVFMRRDIREREDEETGQTLYDCEEVQARLATPVTATEIEADFDEWWEIIASTPKPQQHTTEERLAQLRADVDFIAVMTGVGLEV